MSNNKYKILVIEDENNIRSFVETTLEAGGYHVLTAGSCRQGIMMFSSHVPDLVILDLGLPDGDGLDLSVPPARTVRSPFSSCPHGLWKATRYPLWIWVPTTM